MKQTILLFASVMILTACASPGSKKSDKETSAAEKPMAVNPDEAVNVAQLMDKASGNVGEEVVIEGVVTHVCKHSGKRCFLKDYGSDTSIRVEAKGEIGGFNSELNGTRLAIKGFIREKRYSEDEIREWEQRTLKQEEEAEIDEDQCSAELANIEEMRDWMKANNKNYYAIYYVDGMDYTIIE